MRILYLPIETSVRELDGKLLLASEAIARGYFVYIGNKEIVKRIAEEIGYGIFLFKTHAINFPFDLKRNNMIYIGLDEEGLYARDKKKFIERMKRGNPGGLDKIFFWGNYQRELFLSNTNIKKEQTVASGHPRFDLLRKEFAKQREKESNIYKSQYRKYILVATNFGKGNFSKSSGKDIYEHYESLNGSALDEKEYEIIKRQVEDAKKLLGEYKSFVKEVSDKHPNINIIIRPHPSENRYSWIEEFEGSNNVIVDNSGNIHDWIDAALFVIHAGSTSGVEACIMGKDVIMYNPVYTDETKMLTHEYGIEIRGRSSLIEIIHDLINETGKYEFCDSKMKNLIANTGDEMATKTIMDTIDELILEKNINLVGHNKIATKYSLNKNNIKHDIALILAGIMGKLTFINFNWYNLLASKITNRVQKIGVIKKGYLSRKINEYTEILYPDKELNIDVKRVGANTYLIGGRK